MTVNVSGVAVESLAQEFGTPFYVYDKEVILDRIRQASCFPTVRYAQKALSNIHILRLMRENKVLVDAVSAGEIHRALLAGYLPDAQKKEIVFTADLFDRDALDLIKKHSLPVNVGSPDMIAQLGEQNIHVPLIIRLNPGFGHGHSRKTNTGGDLSKHGVWHTQLKDCLQLAQHWNLKVVGLHIHIGSGSDLEHLSQVANTMAGFAVEVPHLELISAGGGVPIPYKKDQAPVDWAGYLKVWQSAVKSIESKIGRSIHLELEPGRYLVAESGKLITEIRAIKKMGANTFYLVDAGFDNLIRPAMYGSYHHITICPTQGRTLGPEQPVIVGGPLCESGDVFTQEEGGFVTTRVLPKASVGDLLVIHDTGAYGSAMASNYNTRRLAPEILLSQTKAQIIRRRQTFEEVLSTETTT